MSTIRFTVEDSKVPGVLEALLNSNISIKDVEVSGLKSDNKLRVSSYKYVVADPYKVPQPYVADVWHQTRTVKDSGPNVTLSQSSSLIGQYESVNATNAVSDLKMVGGTIFYIDNAIHSVYEFFDIDGNLIENVQVGDRPYAYRVISKDPGDKYYVYYDELYYSNKRWTYYKEGDSVLESLNTLDVTGLGKANTEIVMSKDNGAYITEDSNGCPTIWYQLQRIRNAKVGGCDDWFVPSKGEIEDLRLAVESGSITGGEIAGPSYGKSVFNNSYVWSSSEFSSQYAWIWDSHCQGWFFCYKSNNYPVFFVRAF